MVVLSMRSVTILGATGSVGTSTLDLVMRNPGRFRIVALTAHTDVAGLVKAARATNAELAVIGDESCHTALSEALAGTTTRVASGAGAVVEAAGSGADWTMAAVVGCAGLRATLAALRGGRTVALANKESLVSAGDVMMTTARTSGATLLPVDSEHNAIFQCLVGNPRDRVRRIVLTASGGPFRSWTREAMRDVTPEVAVKHPNWSMGAKISIDSATLMNKGLELIEARHLFACRPDELAVVVHPQSVIHSMVDYVDGSTLAQLGCPDMRVPIASALAWPDRMPTPCEPLDLARIGRLDFEEPDLDRFPALRLALAALVEGGARPAVLNAANEVAVAAFLARKIGFLQIAELVERVLTGYDPAAPDDVEAVLAIDSEARSQATDILQGMAV